MSKENIIRCYLDSHGVAHQIDEDLCITISFEDPKELAEFKKWLRYSGATEFNKWLHRKDPQRASGLGMVGMNWGIFKNAFREGSDIIYPDDVLQEAIRTITEAGTINSIKKDELLNALRYMVNKK